MKSYSKNGSGEKTVNDRRNEILKKEIMLLLPSVSVSTTEAELTRLMKSGKIVKVGRGPETKYRKA